MDPLKFFQHQASIHPIERRETKQVQLHNGSTFIKKKRGDRRLKSPKVRKAKVFYHGQITYKWNGTQTVPVTPVQNCITCRKERNPCSTEGRTNS